tara:strand:+ start:516 stop:740 length:225 start_codon:yes stop_codon:yes gene_type:complete
MISRNLKLRANFFSRSECNELCFHAHEYRFNIEEINKILEINQLAFLCFLEKESVKSLYGLTLPEDQSLKNLEN